LDLARDRWRSVNGTIGVSTILQTGGMPAPVPSGLVEHLQSRTSESGQLGFEDQFAPGSEIRIVGGPFDRLFGVFQRLDGEGRASVLLEIMGRPIAVSLPRVSIMAVS
jgi:transcriptional antiterminator RfaH